LLVSTAEKLYICIFTNSLLSVPDTCFFSPFVVLGIEPGALYVCVRQGLYHELASLCREYRFQRRFRAVNHCVVSLWPLFPTSLHVSFCEVLAVFFLYQLPSLAQDLGNFGGRGVQMTFVYSKKLGGHNSGFLMGREDFLSRVDPGKRCSLIVCNWHCTFSLTRN
jgi:hypothetical protein